MAWGTVLRGDTVFKKERTIKIQRKIDVAFVEDTPSMTEICNLGELCSCWGYCLRKNMQDCDRFAGHGGEGRNKLIEFQMGWISDASKSFK